MIAVLPPDLSFATLAAALHQNGWRQERIAGLRPPLIPGEPELARFVRGDAVLAYSLNPALHLRIVEGPLPATVARLAPARIGAMIGAAVDRTALCGALAAAALGLTELADAIATRAATLPPALRGLADRAVDTLRR